MKEKEMTVFDMECTKINRAVKYERNDNLDYLDGLCDAFIYMRDYVHETYQLDDEDNDFICYETRILTEFNSDKLLTSVRMGIKALFDEFVCEIWQKADEKYNLAVQRQEEVLDLMYQEDLQVCIDRHQTTQDFSECEECYTPECPFSERQSTGTPCDYPDYEGHYSCPFDAQGGDDCRNFCGLGVDE